MSYPLHLQPTEASCPRAGSEPRRRHRVLVLASTFPSREQPIHGAFVKERIRFVHQLDDLALQVVSPVPYFPPLPQFPRWYPLSQIPRRERIDELDVLRPRYFLPPKIGGWFHPRLLYWGARRTIARCAAGDDIDLFDGHFIYPDGVAATMFAQHYDRPVVLTGRGEEILRFPQLPLMGRAIRWALSRATRLIALSDEIAEAMRSLGADREKITTIPNGVDCQRFRPRDQAAARRRLGLPLDRPIVLSVGYRLERKGFHLLVEAMAQIRRRVPNVLALMVGGPARWGEDYTPVIQRKIAEHDIADNVRLVGSQPPDQLPDWYNAADLFTLLTSREGSPNVVLEALACGLPVVTTPIADLPKILADNRLGVLLPERSVPAAAEGILQALERSWDRAAIRSTVEAWSWSATARRVHDVFLGAIDDHRARLAVEKHNLKRRAN